MSQMTVLVLIVVRVARIDDHEAGRRAEKDAHVLVELIILNEMIDDVERQGQVCLLAGLPVQQLEGLALIACERGVTEIDRGRADIEAQVARIVGE